LARKILLADDSVTAQNMGRKILSEAGYEVITVNNGSAALKKIAEQKPDLIVLDVYMPGYGGLEVCQRIKDTKETARIPVLLTVGKLEPFKPEEARRVHADGFIVKPFEVSELLAVLTKLEDKIVPQPETYKPGRFAKAIAAVENSDPGEKFGNAETGWKNRIIIPSAGNKTEESEPVPHVTNTGTAFRDLGRGEDFKPAEAKSTFERPIPIGLPPDITPEEIAAITAAAAAFEKPIAQTVTAAQESKAEPTPQSRIVEASSSATNSSDETSGMVQPMPGERRKGERRERREATLENTYGSIQSVTPESPSDVSTSSNEVASVAPLTDQPGTNFEETMQPQVEPPAGPDAEVAAALAFLAPTKLEGEGTNAGLGSQVEQERWASYGSTGPRWVAEQIPVDEQEATLPLDREVEKTHAAFAAALANVGNRAEAAGGTFAPCEGAQNNSIQESAMASAETTAAAGLIANIQPDALFYSAPIAEIKEFTPLADATPAAEREELASFPKEESAYAAAASAGTSGTEPETNPETKPQPVMSENPSDSRTPEPGDLQRESEMKAAWANWRQIRESIVGSDSTSHVEDANAGYRDSGKEDPPSSPMSNEDASSSEPPQTEASEIATIVETMLAELKPKLMEEIAKKMDTEKKGKKKKKTE
jgi:CheY-like chemotaxis protein